MNVFRLIIGLLLLPLLGNTQLRVEPMNWWTDMKTKELQLLIHGDNISSYLPQLNYPGVRLTKVNRAESKNYLFLDLEISQQAKTGKFPIRFKKNGAADLVYDFELKQRQRNPSSLEGFSSKDVICLITPDRFANGDPSNDVVAGMKETRVDRNKDFGRHGGDIRGIIDHLDYFSSMGYTALWPTPMLENDMGNASYHGYAITDHYEVDPRFGTLTDYIELADKCRQRNLKLIFDGVVNHTGINYWWMKDLPFRDWINYPDSFQGTNHRRTVNEDPYASEADRKIMVKGWFVQSMPDLNQSNPFLANYLIQNNIWWIETLGLNGIRQDTYPYSEKKFLEKWTCRIMNEYPNFSIVGEEWTTNPLLVAYWQQGKQNGGEYNGCLKSTMDFPTQDVLVRALTESEDWNKGFVNLYENLANDFVYVRPKDLLVFADNHDMDRIFTQVNNDPDLLQMALTYILTIRGIPSVYYGTEMLLNNTGHHKNDGLIRADFPGGWPTDSVNGFLNKNLSTDQVRVKKSLSALMNWRKNADVIHNGNTMHFAPKDGIYVYARYNNKKTVLVIMNKNNENREINLAAFKEVTGKFSQAKNVLTGEKYNTSSPINVNSKSATVLDLF